MSRPDAALRNAHGQPIGAPLPDWQAPPAPAGAIEGRYARVEPLDVARHGDALVRALHETDNAAGWTYLGYGPFADAGQCRQWLGQVAGSTDPSYRALIDQTSGEALGLASFMRIDRANGVIEVGNLHFGPAMRARPMATEAMMLMMKQAFELGYRRYEWKCDALNAPSRVAARRYGFHYEGEFRQSVVYKGRTRDTAWFSIIDSEWPAVRRAFDAWLKPANFAADGRQKVALSALMSDAVAALPRET